MFDTQVTVVGNLVAEPRLSSTKDGQSVASFRLASTPRRFDRATGEWKDGDTLFTGVTCWRSLAENVYQSLKKGNSVIVIGRLSVRPYETKDGDKRQSVDIDAMAIGPDLSRVTTIIKRAERTSTPAIEAEVEAPSEHDLLRSDVVDGNGEDDEATTPHGIDWGVSFTEPLDASVDSDFRGEVAQMDDDGPGRAIDLMPAPMAPAAEPVPAQLASSGGRWRGRSAG